MIYFNIEGTEFSAPVEEYFIDEEDSQACVLVNVEISVNVKRVKRVERAAGAGKGGAA